MANLKDLLVNGVTRFIGKVYAPTPETGDNSTQVATTAFVMKNVEQISEALNNKMDRSGGNATDPLDSSFLGLIGGSIGGSAIDYSSPVNIGSFSDSNKGPFTIPADGVVFVAPSDSNFRQGLLVNGTLVTTSSSYNAYGLSKSDKITIDFSPSGYTYTIIFFPYKT